jgi:hypothetical protein
VAEVNCADKFTADKINSANPTRNTVRFFIVPLCSLSFCLPTHMELEDAPIQDSCKHLYETTVIYIH